MFEVNAVCVNPKTEQAGSIPSVQDLQEFTMSLLKSRLKTKDSQRFAIWGRRI